MTSETREYTFAGRLHRATNGEGDVVEYGYDDAGRQSRMTLDPDGPEPLSTITNFDPAGRVASVTTPEGRTTTTETTYENGERVETVTLPGQAGLTRRRFNFRDELVEDDRLYVNNEMVSAVHFEYDDRGNVAAVTDADGARVTYSYDVWTSGPKSGIAFWPDCHSTWTGAIE